MIICVSFCALVWASQSLETWSMVIDLFPRNISITTVFRVLYFIFLHFCHFLPSCSFIHFLCTIKCRVVVCYLRERDGCLIPCIASAAMDNGGKTTFWMTWLWMDLFLPSLFIPLTSGSQLAEECWDITSLRFFYFHLFLFFFSYFYSVLLLIRNRAREITRRNPRERES